MNIFHIPSWFPSENDPLDGIFVEEQIKSIGEFYPEVKNIVSKWGHFDAYFPVLKPWKIFKILKWRLYNSKRCLRKNNFYWEVFSPTIYWHHKIPLGGHFNLLQPNRLNLEKAIKYFGKIDLIHAHITYPGGYIAKILSKQYSIPYIISEHMGPFPFPSLLKHNKPIEELMLALKYASSLIAVSPSLADKMSDLSKKNVSVIPNMVDRNLFDISKFSSDKFTFFTLAGIGPFKGIDILIKAISIWRPSEDKFKFIIGGDGPNLIEYKKLAKKLNVDQLVEWVGYIPKTDTPKYFKNCHVFVLPSFHESFGIVYAEALACGKPIIATKCGGPESIVNDFNGKLVDVGDPENLAKTMKHMSENYDQYNPTLIRKDFEERFSRASVVKKIIDVYQGILSNSSKI
jgi:glycosyltransferase involved in cell wall biosynthesis